MIMMMNLTLAKATIPTFASMFFLVLTPKIKIKIIVLVTVTIIPGGS